MQSKWVSTLLLLFCLLGFSLTAPDRRFFPRADSAAITLPTAASSTQVSSHAAVTSGPPAPATTVVSGFNSTNRTTTASQTVTSIVLPSDYLNQTLNATMFPADELPLPPEITPALSVAGVILMISGFFYCLVGIKKKWIQISISSAYLVALAISVLIIYVVNPPISLAIQGAYVVAAVVPSLLLGAVACIFHDVTEGLGCAIGGFAISMFFMVLKPGGLLTNAASKAIFIGVWTVAVFCFSFSHYTRVYALIGSTAIGGSTAVILGIDCFSRAGLKEFWVYIWGLNANLFPPFVQSYPMTRGIKVEIAGIVVFTFFGVLSQLKIWKIVQARKEKKEQARRDADHARDELEAELGRKVEEGNERDRGQWEAMYGEKHAETEMEHRDSGVGTEASSTHKPSMCGDEQKYQTKAVVTTVETEDCQTPTGLHPSGAAAIMPHGIIVQVGEDDIASMAGAPSEYMPQMEAKMPALVLEDSQSSPIASQNGSTRNTTTKQNLVKQDDMSSTKAAGEARLGQSQPSPTETNFSLAVPLHHGKRDSFMSHSSVEAIVDPDVLDSLDGLSDSQQSIPEASSESKPTSLEDATSNSSISVEQEQVSKSQEVIGTAAVQASPEIAASNEPTTLQAAADSPKASRNGSVTDGNANDAAVVAEQPKGPPSVKSVEKASVRSEQPVPAKPTLETLASEQANPIIQQFRTNEWAKHLSEAEAPQFDTLKPAEKRERASVVDAAALLQTPLTAEPEPINEISSPEAPTSPQSPRTPARHYTPGGRAIPHRVPSIIYTAPTSPLPSPPASIASNGSQRAPSRQQSTGSTRRMSSSGAMRNSTSPLANIPISENEEMTFHSPPTMPLPTGTLLAERSSMVAHKNMTGQLPARSRSTGPYDGSAPSSTTSLQYGQYQMSPPMSPPMSPQSMTVLSDESLPLSTRKSHLKLQQHQDRRLSVPTHRALSRSSTLPHQSAYYSPAVQQQGYAQPAAGPIVMAPQPVARRSATDPALRQTSMLSAWRASMVAEQQRTVVTESPWTGDASGSGLTPMAMPSKAPKKVWRDGRTRNGAEGWGSSGEGRTMRQMGAREMDNAHREVLRRMQANANRKLATEGM